MGKVPSFIVTSLMTLGLLESEAKVYAALVLFKNAGVKDIIEFLDISKPSVYESLRTLRERGLAVITNTRPTTYQAIPPEVGIKILMKTYTKAAREALEHLKEFEREVVVDKPPEALWSIYGAPGIEVKIEDMIGGARESVVCVAPERYWDSVRKAAGKGLDVTLVVITGDESVGRELKRAFKKDKVQITMITTGELIGMFTALKSTDPVRSMQGYRQALESFDFNNMLLLIVDGNEFLYVPPLPGNVYSALYTNNRTLIMTSTITVGGMKMAGREL
jgi:sugar-specific transcriptional regulator TrmB